MNWLRLVVLLVCSVFAMPAIANVTQRQKITSEPRGVGAQFGNAVALNGNTMVIGARFDGTTATQAGAAFVYVLNGTTWTQQAKLLASDGAVADKFGYSVAISGDTIVVGAYQANAPLSNGGAAYVFVRNGTTWTQQQKGCFILVVACLSSAGVVNAQHKDLMGGNWNNPVSASIGNIINDRIWTRMRAKARARRKSESLSSANSNAPENRVADPESPKKSAAQIAAATRFRSTGTQLTTRELANASGNTPEEKEQMFKLMGTALILYEAEARRLGRPNDFALALAVALAVNSSVYNGKPEPEEARLLEIGDAIGELMAEDNVFGGITDKQKQEMYETMVIFTMLVQAGANEAKQGADAASAETYRQLAGKVLTSISGMPPEKIRLDTESTATAVDNPTARREESLPPAAAATSAAMHAAALVKEFESNEVRANQLYVGKRVSIFGTVNSIEIDSDGKIVLTFKSSISTYNNARCYFSKSQGSRVAGINANDQATVEGTVRGLGGGWDGTKAFVVLENCIVP